MPGTDGPGQFPAHNHIISSLVPLATASLSRPKSKCEIIGVQIIRGTFLSPPPSHTHPHSFRKPKCSLSQHISFVSRKKYANARFLHFSTQADCQVCLGWRHRVQELLLLESWRVGVEEHLRDLNPKARLSLGISLS